MRNNTGIEFKKMTTSINVDLLDAVDRYAADNYISRASAIHLLLMEAMKKDDIQTDANTTRIMNTVKIVVNIPVKVADDLEEYITKHKYRAKTVGIYTLLTSVLERKQYWNKE